MAAKFIEKGILGTSRKCSKDGEKGGTPADRIPDARYPRKMERRSGRIPDVRHPGGVLAEKNSGCETFGVECWQRKVPSVSHPGGMLAEENFGCVTSGWNGDGEGFRV